MSALVVLCSCTASTGNPLMACVSRGWQRCANSPTHPPSFSPPASATRLAPHPQHGTQAKGLALAILAEGQLFRRFRIRSCILDHTGLVSEHRHHFNTGLIVFCSMHSLSGGVRAAPKAYPRPGVSMPNAVAESVVVVVVQTPTHPMIPILLLLCIHE